MPRTKKWNRILAEQKRKEQSRVLTIPEYDLLKLSAADEKRYREEYMGFVPEECYASKED